MRENEGGGKGYSVRNKIFSISDKSNILQSTTDGKDPCVSGDEEVWEKNHAVTERTHFF